MIFFFGNTTYRNCQIAEIRVKMSLRQSTIENKNRERKVDINKTEVIKQKFLMYNIS